MRWEDAWVNLIPGTARTAAEPETEDRRNGSFLRELPLLVVLAFAIALLVKTLLVQAFWIPSGSMENTLLPNDRVLVSKLSYRLGDPKPGDIVVFVSPPGEDVPTPSRSGARRLLDPVLHAIGLGSAETDYIKRVIATGGQTVEIKDGHVFVDGRRISEPYLKENRALPDFAAYHVPNDSLFVMGDNRFGSHDSRSFANKAIKRSTVVGKAFVLMWPPARFGSLR